MTRAERRSRARRIRAAQGHLQSAVRAPIAAGILLTENPNRGKHGTGRMVGPHDPTAIDGRYFDPRETEYAPLTVRTPLWTRTGRHSRRGGSPEYSSYTV